MDINAWFYFKGQKILVGFYVKDPVETTSHFLNYCILIWSFKKKKRLTRVFLMSEMFLIQLDTEFQTSKILQKDPLLQPIPLLNTLAIHSQCEGWGEPFVHGHRCLQSKFQNSQKWTDWNWEVQISSWV